MGAAKISTYLFTKYSYLPSYLNLPSVRRITNETERRRRAIQLVREDYLATHSKRKHLAVRITDVLGVANWIFAVVFTLEFGLKLLDPVAIFLVFGE